MAAFLLLQLITFLLGLCIRSTCAKDEESVWDQNKQKGPTLSFRGSVAKT